MEIVIPMRVDFPRQSCGRSLFRRLLRVRRFWRELHASHVLLGVYFLTMFLWMYLTGGLEDAGGNQSWESANFWSQLAWMVMFMAALGSLVVVAVAVMGDAELFKSIGQYSPEQWRAEWDRVIILVGASLLALFSCCLQFWGLTDTWPAWLSFLQ